MDTCAPLVCKQTSDVISGDISRTPRPEQHGGHTHTAIAVVDKDNRPEYILEKPAYHGPDALCTSRGHGPPPGHTGQPTQPASQTHTTGGSNINPPVACQEPDFYRIRQVCQKGDYEHANIDLRPTVFVEYKKRWWPTIAPHTMHEGMISIYDVVRGTGLPNALGARIPVPSNLKLHEWEKCLGEIGGRAQLLDFLTYGFPIGYVGPVSDSRHVKNHPSADQYPKQVEAFLDKEISKGGLMGPYSTPPFTPWCHVSPLMSRPKATEGDRRIITDMTFPDEVSVNAYIVKNGIFGIEMDHSLPTVDGLVQFLRHAPTGVHLATMDIARAYKNLISDPLDWPLLCFAWRGQHYCDVTVPFGARASSFHMQTVANAIVDVLAARGIKSYMYLDDLILVSPNREKADQDFTESQVPAQRVKWLGILVDTQEMSLSIPHEKIQQVLSQVSKYVRARSMSKKQLQPLLGVLLHVAKCVRPARLFIARLLDALRNAKGWFININADMRADMRWFLEFAAQWNGKSYIPAPSPTMYIYVDACLSTVGGSDGKRAYAGQVTPITDGVHNITELEALNVVLALHTFLGKESAGAHVRIHCDNNAAVQVLQSGRGRNKVLLDCARAAWMVQAVLDVHVSYVHVPGKDNEIADRLSRAHLAERDHLLARQSIHDNALTMIDPCLYFIDNIRAPVLSRSGTRLLSGQGHDTTDEGQSTGNMGKPALNGGDIRGVRTEGCVPPTTAQGAPNLPKGVFSERKFVEIRKRGSHLPHTVNIFAR